MNHGYSMAVMTRIDARSQRNNSIQIQDLDGNILCVVEAVRNNNPEGTSTENLRNQVGLRIQTSDSVRIVKSNGVVLRKN